MSSFTPRDDLLHDISGSPHGRESLLWTSPIPDEKLLVFTYAWRHADTGDWGRLLAVGGDDIDRPLALAFDDGLAFEGDDLDDCVVGGLRIRQPEPLTVAEVSFASDDVDYACRFTGLHAPFSWHENRGGCPSWAADDRYEQSVATEGRLRVAGRDVAIAGHGHRDHSWGTRDWRALQHWKWMNAATDDGEVSLHAWDSLALGNRQILGYVNRGGEMSLIEDIDVSVELDDRLVHRAVRAAITDAEGRETRFEATYAAGWQVPVEHLFMNEIGMHAEIDGASAVAHVELGWPQAYVRQYTEAASAAA